MIIYNAKPETYLDENLTRPMEVYTPANIEGQNSDVLPMKFVGNGGIEVPGYGKMKIQFEIEVDTLAKAYEKYEESFAAELKRIEEDSNASKIVTPSKDIII